MSLAVNASYFSGSYMLVSHLQIDLEGITISNFDPMNMTRDPTIELLFSFSAPQTGSGEATLSSMHAVVYLNDDHLSYPTFRRIFVGTERIVQSGYQRNFTLGSVVKEDPDKQTLINAAASDNWTFAVQLYLLYHILGSRSETVRILAFTYEGYTGD
ncbi:MAG: hypothetical protein HXY34_13990 [Candidatus Thorarchaeota archaeon]|nr:hypothetical protein [Candidatus Thorarchaeota archaeon]